jgi:retrograde regulation protein 2
VPIPSDTINKVIITLNYSKIIYTDLAIPKSNIYVIAIKATYTALNSTKFIKKVKVATRLTINILPKEEERYISSLGVISSFSDIRGLIIDVSGGSI